MIKTSEQIQLKSKAKGKGCWYKITIEECAACGKSKSYRERMYVERPDEPIECYVYDQYLCSRCIMGDY